MPHGSSRTSPVNSTPRSLRASNAARASGVSRTRPVTLPGGICSNHVTSAIVAWEPGGASSTHRMPSPKGSQATIALVTWFDQMPPGSVTGLVLDTPDARAAYEALRERGVEFTGEVREDPWGTSASFVDPDGNGWVLMQTPEGAG